jgi:copper chaperone
MRKLSPRFVALRTMRGGNGCSVFALFCPQQQKLEFRVGMTCGGCKSAVTKILQKTPGVASIDADVDKKQVIVRPVSLFFFFRPFGVSALLVQVTGSVSSDQVLEALSKWSKAANKEVAFVKAL